MPASRDWPDFDILWVDIIIRCSNEQLVATILLSHRLARGEGRV